MICLTELNGQICFTKIAASPTGGSRHKRDNDNNCVMLAIQDQVIMTRNKILNKIQMHSNAKTIQNITGA